MKERSVRFSEQARSDLADIYEWVSSVASWETAGRYITRLEHACTTLNMASERGTPHDDVRRGLRIIGFEKRISIAFEVVADEVVILRLISGGRDWQTEFAYD